MFKLFDRIIFKQRNEYIEQCFSNLLTVFRKNRRKEILGKMETSFKRDNFVDTIFIDLSKAFDTLNYYLLIAKPGAYELSTTC